MRKPKTKLEESFANTYAVHYSALRNKQWTAFLFIKRNYHDYFIHSFQ